MKHINYICDCCGAFIANNKVNILDMPRIVSKFPCYEHLEICETHLCNDCMAKIANSLEPVFANNCRRDEDE